MSARNHPTDAIARSRRPWPSSPRLLAIAVGVASLALLVIAGLAGSQDGSRNPANYLAWLYFWPGIPILVALAGDLWRYLDPWRQLGSMLLRVDFENRALMRGGMAS